MTSLNFSFEPQYDDPEGYFTVWADTESLEEPDPYDIRETWLFLNPGAAPDDVPDDIGLLTGWYRDIELSNRLSQVLDRVLDLDPADGLLVRRDVCLEDGGVAIEARPVEGTDRFDLERFLFRSPGQRGHARDGAESPVALYEDAGGSLRAMRFVPGRGEVVSTLRVALRDNVSDLSFGHLATSTGGAVGALSRSEDLFDRALDLHMAREYFMGPAEDANVIEVGYGRARRRYGLVRGAAGPGGPAVLAYNADSSFPWFNDLRFELTGRSPIVSVPDADDPYDVSGYDPAAVFLRAELVRARMLRWDDYREAWSFTDAALDRMPTIEDHLARNAPLQAPTLRYPSR